MVYQEAVIYTEVEVYRIRLYLSTCNANRASCRSARHTCQHKFWQVVHILVSVPDPTNPSTDRFYFPCVILEAIHVLDKRCGNETRGICKLACKPLSVFGESARSASALHSEQRVINYYSQAKRPLQIKFSATIVRYM